MDWLRAYHKEKDNQEKEERAKIKKDILDDMKKRHFLEKNKAVEELKKKLLHLEKDIQCYR